VLALHLALLSLAAAPADGRGTDGTTPEDALSRRAPGRVRLGAGGAALIGVTDFAAAAGAGLWVDGGLVFADRFSFFLHGELGEIGAPSSLLTLISSGGPVFEVSLGEHFSSGLGAAITLWSPISNSDVAASRYLGASLPLRFHFSPMARSPTQTRHAGLLLGLQVAPGILWRVESTAPQVPVPPEWTFTGALTVGYAWW
jgi:hypothetical protein